MATYHLTVKAGAKGKAAPHAEYISRDGKYSGRDRYEDLEATAYGNMPKWAEHNPAHFWQASDQYERANGTAYREIEIALPRELTPEQRRELVEAFVSHKIGDSHAYQWAIHTPKAALEKGEQPHAHIMYSERKRDDLERDPSHYFKRYNAKNPEKGGNQKGDSGGTKTERNEKRKAELIALRESWATLQNKHLERHGHAATVDHRSLKDQGSTRAAEKHLGGSGVRQLDASRISTLLEYRAAEGERERAQRELSSVIDLSGDLTAAKKASELKPLPEPEKVGFLAKMKNLFAPKSKNEPVQVIEPAKQPAELTGLKLSRGEKIIHSYVPQAAPVITAEELKKQYEDMPIRKVFDTYNGFDREGVPRNEMHPTLIRRVDDYEKRNAPVIKPVPKLVQPKEIAASKPVPIPKPAPIEIEPAFKILTHEELKKQYEDMPIEKVFEVFRDLAKRYSREEIHPTLTRRVDEWGKQQAAAQEAKTSTKAAEQQKAQPEIIKETKDKEQER